MERDSRTRDCTETEESGDSDVSCYFIDGEILCDSICCIIASTETEITPVREEVDTRESAEDTEVLSVSSSIIEIIERED